LRLVCSEDFSPLFRAEALTTNLELFTPLYLDGDRQADLSVHGGQDKAVYTYPFEHYDYWRRKLPDMDLPWGMFGENFTTVGLLEDEINIGVHEVCAIALSLPDW
jgi:MOSC domain-containing protein YiiM